MITLKKRWEGLIAAAILVSAAALKVGGALASGRVTHMVANNPEDHNAPDVIKEKRERERMERERRGGERGRGQQWRGRRQWGARGEEGEARRRNSSGPWQWWTCRSRIKTWTTAAMAGAAMAVAAAATAAMGMGPTLSSLH
jgi:hypothetical protein